MSPQDTRNATPVKVPLVTQPLGILGSLNAARSNILSIIPEIATRQPMVSGRTAKRWHMVMDPNAIKRMLDRYQAERHSLSAALPDKVEVYSHVARYASAEPATAWRWLLSTLLLAAASSVLLVALCLRWWGGGAAALGGGASAALLLPSALLLAALSRVKLFIMFHDCTHNALFGTPRNEFFSEAVTDSQAQTVHATHDTVVAKSSRL